MDYANRSPSVLKPILVLSKFPNDASFQTPSLMDDYRNITDSDLSRLSHWEDKSDIRLFWRGSTTGGFNADTDFKESHRLRLHLMINGRKGGDAAWESKTREVMVPDGKGGFEIVKRSDKVLSESYADIKLSNGPIQVSCSNPIP